VRRAVRALLRGYKIEKSKVIPIRAKVDPLIHTLPKFNLAQNVEVSQRFSSLSNSLPQTGHTFSVCLIIRSALHLEHLTGWSLTLDLVRAQEDAHFSFSLPRLLCTVGLPVIRE
jgi:hypothetical protein